MKLYPPRQPRPAPSPVRIPIFHAVPARARRDGWTPLRQAEFIGHLAETGSVSEAARRVSMARETAYRLRARPWSESFRTAWDTALGARSQRGETLARKVTVEELQWRVDSGLWQIRLAAGRFVGVWRKADNAALLQLLARTGHGVRPSAASRGPR